MRPSAFLMRDIQVSASYKTAFFLDLAAIVFNVATFFFLGKLVDPSGALSASSLPAGYFAFAVIGLAVSDLVTASLQDVATSVSGEQYAGTLESLFTSPTSPGVIASCLPLWSAVQMVARSGAYLLVGWLFFGLQLSIHGLPAAVLAVGLSLLSFLGLGMMGASCVLVLKRGNPIGWIVGSAMALLGGVYYPVDLLPGWLQSVATLLPITYALRVLRSSLLAGQPLAAAVPDLLVLGLFAAILLPAGLVCFVWAVRRCRIEGTLGHY